MWLTCSSVGRKYIMAISGAVLVLFVTFHCCMNSIAICWPSAYNSLCEFLGANWYALIASVFLALFILIHIVYACALSLQNRKARGPVGYSVSKKPKTVEWSSKNMLVLGIVILAFLVVHLIQFWAKMQLQEIRGVHDVLPPTAGTLFLQEAFQTNWTWIVYIIGFIALWFHLNHGIWSMFQSVGWDNRVWIERLKKVAVCWSSVVCLVFIAQAIVFTAKAHEGFFKNDPVLREQYKEMMAPMFDKDFGPDAMNLLVGKYGVINPSDLTFNQFSDVVDEVLDYVENNYPESISDRQIQMQLMMLPTPQEKEEFLDFVQRKLDGRERLRSTKRFLDYLNGVEPQPEQEQAQVQVQPQGVPAGIPEGAVYYIDEEDLQQQLAGEPVEEDANAPSTPTTPSTPDVPQTETTTTTN